MNAILSSRVFAKIVSMTFRIIPLAVVALTCLSASAVTWSTWNGTNNWSNAATWAGGIPSGTGAGALVQSGILMIDGTSGDPSVNAVLVGWAGNSSIQMTGGSLTVTGTAGDQILSVGESLNKTGTFTQSGGTVTANVFSLGRAGGTGVYNLNGGELHTDTIYGNTGSGTFNFGGGTLVTSTGKLTLQNNAVGYYPLTLAGTNTFAGNVLISSGFVQLGADNALGSGALSFSAAPAAGRASLNMNGFNQTIRGLTAPSATLTYGDIYNHKGKPTSTLTINTPTSESYTNANQIGALPGDWSNIALVKQGNGTQVLSGTNNYTHGTTVAAGTLIGQTDRAFGIGNIVVANGAKLVLKNGVSNNYISDLANVVLGSSASLALDFTGTADTVDSLSLDGGITTITAGTYTAAALSGLGTGTYTGTGSLTVTTSGENAWANSWGVDIGASTDDYDHDGLLNIYEYGLGGNPTDNTDQGVSPTFGSMIMGGTNYFRYIHPQLKNPNSGISYHLEISTNLVSGSWVNSGYSVLGTNVPAEGTLNYVTNITSMVDSKKYIRLIIE